MHDSPLGPRWKPGRIDPKAVAPSVTVSLRVPRDLLDALDRYAKDAQCTRSYLITECLRRLLAATRLAARRRKARAQGVAR
jgi:metal-responsive CopG/Arc/MetJ family transcriptional regulator